MSLIVESLGKEFPTRSGPLVVLRFKSGWHNFEHVYRPLVDHWMLYDNSGPAPILIAKGTRQ